MAKPVVIMSLIGIYLILMKLNSYNCVEYCLLYCFQVNIMFVLDQSCMQGESRIPGMLNKFLGVQ